MRKVVKLMKLFMALMAAAFAAGAMWHWNP